MHHLSCSGGTVISKCLAAMKDVVFLSEVHPTTSLNLTNIHFEPFDPLRLFQANYPDLSYKNNNDLKKIFHERLWWVVRKCREYNKSLIIRDHPHSDFLVEGCTRNPTLLSFLSDIYATKALVTLRNPVDSYLSLKSNNDFVTDVNDFDTYCQRVLDFLDKYSFADVILYEDFVDDPESVLKKICDIYGIQYDASYKDNFHNIMMTGNSGRGRNLKEIKKLRRRPFDETFWKEVEGSVNFKRLSEKYSRFSQELSPGREKSRISFFRRYRIT